MCGTSIQMAKGTRAPCIAEHCMQAAGYFCHFLCVRLCPHCAGPGIAEGGAEGGIPATGGGGGHPGHGAGCQRDHAPRGHDAAQEPAAAQAGCGRARVHELAALRAAPAAHGGHPSHPRGVPAHLNHWMLLPLSLAEPCGSYKFLFDDCCVLYKALQVLAGGAACLRSCTQAGCMHPCQSLVCLNLQDKIQSCTFAP